MRVDAKLLGSSRPPFRPIGLFHRRVGDARHALEGRIASARLLYVATETGARFVRERIKGDPLDWLLTRHDLFEGYTPAESCRGEEGFRRAVVLHGLSLGLDVHPRVIEGIPAHEFLSSAARDRLFPGLRDASDDPEPWRRNPSALYTCSISAELDDEHVQVFCAMIARNPSEVRGRVRQRYGPLLEDVARVRLGFDWSEPLACAMVSEAMAHVLRLAEAQPTAPFACGLDFQVEQRFAS